MGLARALIGQPQLLIIDEGFNAMDADIERSLSGVICDYSRAHAVLVITHNFSSLLKSDFTYLLRDGRIAEQGTPETLLQQKSAFRRWAVVQDPSRASLCASVL